MTTYHYDTVDGKRCRLSEKQVGTLLSRLYRAILDNRITIARFPYDNYSDCDFVAYERQATSTGNATVIRYSAIIDNDGISRSAFAEIRYPAFANALLSGDDISVADSRTGDALKLFRIWRGA